MHALDVQKKKKLINNENLTNVYIIIIKNYIFNTNN